jgi:hypothetical protein
MGTDLELCRANGIEFRKPSGLADPAASFCPGTLADADPPGSRIGVPVTWACRYSRTMPAPGARNPDSRLSRVHQWYADNPGFHRPVEVADALRAAGAEVTTHNVASDSKVLHERGDLRRRRRTPRGKNAAITTYSA